MKDSNQGNKASAELAKLPLNLMRTRLFNSAASSNFSRAFYPSGDEREGLDLTPVQFAALNTIVQSPGLDQITVANLISYDRVTIGGVIDRLERKELIVRRLSKSDRRARELVPTDNGRKILAKLLPS